MGYKWKVATDVMSETKYMHIPLRSSPALAKAVRSSREKLDRSVLSRALQKILLTIANRPSGTVPTYIETVEANSKRASIDLQFYDYQLTVKDVVPLIRVVCSSLQIDRHQLDRLFELIDECPLGHLSLARDRAGNDFFTVYYEANID